MEGACPYCGLAFEVAPERPATRCGRCGGAFEVHIRRPGAGGRAGPGAPVVAAAAGPGEARCAQHPNNAGDTTCARCGNFICAVCATPLDGRIVCVACVERVLERGEVANVRAEFKLPQTSLSLGILAVLLSWAGLFGVVVGLVAVVTGTRALTRITTQPSLPGRGKAIAGIALGGTALIVSVGALVLIGARGWR